MNIFLMLLVIFLIPVLFLGLLVLRFILFGEVRGFDALSRMPRKRT